MALVIDVNSIPAFQRDALADLVVRMTKEYFETPGAEEEYQAWLAERKSAKACCDMNQQNKFNEKEQDNE